MQNIVGQSSVLTKAVERHSTSAIVKMSSSGTHRCSLIHSKLCRRCVPAGFCSRRSNVVKKNKTLHCFVRLLPLKVSHSWETRHSSPRLLTYTVEVEEFQDLYFIKVTISTEKPNCCRSSNTSKDWITSVFFLSSPYLSVICLYLNDVKNVLPSFFFFFFWRTLDNLISLQQQHLRPLWPCLVSCCVAHRRGADVEPALHGRLDPQWPCVLSKLGLVGHMVGLRLCLLEDTPTDLVGN